MYSASISFKGWGKKRMRRLRKMKVIVNHSKCGAAHANSTVMSLCQVSQE